MQSVILCRLCSPLDTGLTSSPQKLLQFTDGHVSVESTEAYQTRDSKFDPSSGRGVGQVRQSVFKDLLNGSV